MVLESPPPRFTKFWEGDLCRELLFLSTVGKEGLLGGDNKPGGDSVEKEGDVHGLKKRRGAKVDSIKPSVVGDSGIGKMPEEEKRGVTATRVKESLTDSGQEAKQKPVDKKTGKQGKGAGKTSAIRRVGDSQPTEELRAKGDADTNRTMQDLIKTIKCEPYISYASRPGETKPMQRLRPDVHHVAGKMAKVYKPDNGSDPKDMGTETLGMDIHPSDVDGLKDASNSSIKGTAGLGRGSQHSLKVPHGVVALTQAAAKGNDLQGWLSPSKIMTKCEKCTREFCSTLNYRRHLRGHRRSPNPEKEDLSKERSKVASFWDKLTPEEASSIVHYDNMEIEDLSGQSALKALTAFMQQQPGLPSLPQGILKAGALLLDIVQNKPSVFPICSEGLLNILDDASEKTFLCGGTSVVVQRIVFNGDAGKVGLEERNLVASMGFHIELKLVKAWMADKEAEALRCQQALFKEEEALLQKRAKLLEKKRMKKIRQKERKGSASQLILHELENESLDDEGNTQGNGEEDDSPTATGSSASSLVSAQDLALPESAELDLTEDLAQIDEQGLDLGAEPVMDKIMSSDEDQLHHSQDEPLQSGWERSQLVSQEEAADPLYGKEDLFGKEPVMEDREASSLLRPADQVAWDGDIGARLGYPSSQSRSGRAMEVQSSFYLRKGEQERTGPDSKRREFDKPLERKSVRITRDRSQNDYSELVPKPGRDSRGFDARYGDGSQTTFKSLRKVPNTYFLKGDTGNTDLTNSSRVQQYRNKPSGINRPLSSNGTGQAVWTRKNPQPAMEATKDRKEKVIQDDVESSKAIEVNGWDVSEVAQEVAPSVSGFAGGDDATKLDKDGMEKKEDAATPASLEDSRLAGLGDDVMSAEEMPEADTEGLSGALLVGSLSVPLGRSESERENSPKLDVSQVSPTLEDELFTDNLAERDGHTDDQPVAENYNVGKDDHSFPTASVNPAMSVESDSDLPESWWEAARAFLAERWRFALENAFEDEVLNLPDETGFEEAEGVNFLETVWQQMASQSNRHHQGAESTPSSSPSEMTQSLGNPAHDGGVFLSSRIFSDSDQTGVEDVRHPSITDERGLDGGSAQDSGMPEALSSEDDLGMQDTSSSPVDSENYMSGSETSRSYTASSVPSGSEGRRSESRGDWSGGCGSVGSSHVRRANNRQGRWYQNTRDRFPEQRYMPRRRAPVEKNC